MVRAKVLFLLCIVDVSLSSTTTTSTPETRDAKEERINAEFVKGGRLISRWDVNFPESTEDFDLSNLGIGILMEDTFAKFHDLNELNLSWNNLTSSKNVAASLKRTKPDILNVSHNNLGSPKEDWPDSWDDRSYKQNKTFLLDSKYFWSIDLSHNNLVGLGIDFDVVHFNLSNNKIECHNAIETRRFYGTPIFVANLDLSHNMINCQNKFFSTNLETLDMSYNKLTAIESGLFKDLSLLGNLKLSYNAIRYIHPHAFRNLGFLRNVDLKFNKIRTIYKRVWVDTLSLNSIDLSSNKLNYLDWNNSFIFTRRSLSRIQVNVKNNTNVKWSSESSNFIFNNELVMNTI